MDILGSDFTIKDFRIIEPKQDEGGGDPPPQPPNPQDDEPKNNTDDKQIPEELKEKTIDEILEELKKKGLDKSNRSYEDDIDEEGADDEGEDKPDGKPIEGKPDGDKPDENGEKPEKPDGKTEGKKDSKQDKLDEEIREIETKNAITKEINSLNTFKEKYKDILTSKELNFIDKQVDNLRDLKQDLK